MKVGAEQEVPKARGLQHTPEPGNTGGGKRAGRRSRRRGQGQHTRGRGGMRGPKGRDTHSQPGVGNTPLS